MVPDAVRARPDRSRGTGRDDGSPVSAFLGAPWVLVAFLSCGDGPSTAPATPAPAQPPPPAPPVPTAMTLTVEPPTVREDGGAAALTVTAMLVGGTRPEETPVSLTFQGGTATSADYEATATPLTIGAAAVAGTATVVLTPVDDSRLEGVETVVLRGSASGLPEVQVEIAIVDPPVEVFFAAPEFQIREGETQTFLVRYQVADLPAAWNAELSFRPETASEADFRTLGTAVHIPAGRIATGEIAVPLTAVSDLLFDEGDETLAVAFVPPVGATAPRPKLGPDLAVTIAEGARESCRGVGFDSTRPRRSGGILATTLSVEVPRNLEGVSFDWIGPYHDDDVDPEDRTVTPFLEINVADWRMESTRTATEHSLELEWPRFAEIELRFHTGDGACDFPAIVCSRTGCRERS